jgi:hypothetical protein
VPCWLGFVTGLLVAVPSYADPVQGTHHIEITGVTFVVGLGSQNELVVWSERAHYDPVLQAVRLEQVNISVGAALEASGLVIRCERGVFSMVESHFRLEGSVTGRMPDGRRFEAEWLEYDEAQQRLFSGAPVKIIEAGGAYSGGGLEYEIEQGRLKLFDGAHVVRAP